MTDAAIAGRIEGETHIMPIRIYYADTDLTGFVYHANYLVYCERGRSEWLRLLGVPRHVPGEMGFVVRRFVANYLKPAGLDDLVEVHSRLVEASGARMELAQTIRRGEETLFQGEVTVVLVDPRGRPKRVPAEWLATFAGKPVTPH
jgi:acyl-CoA thioester hydrolase